LLNTFLTVHSEDAVHRYAIYRWSDSHGESFSSAIGGKVDFGHEHVHYSCNFTTRTRGEILIVILTHRGNLLSDYVEFELIYMVQASIDGVDCV